MSDATSTELQRLIATAFNSQGWEYDLAVGPQLVETIREQGRVNVGKLVQSLPAAFFDRNRVSKEVVATVIERALGGRTLRDETRVAPSKPLLETLLDYRRFAIRSLSRQFGGKTQGDEDSLRNNLLTWIQPRGYTEAHTGRGRTDILIPAPEDAIIETKVWTTERTYRDGLEELGRYIHTEQPAEAYMVVFGDREPLPSIVSDHRQERAADAELEGLVVPVIVVPFEVDAPSKAAVSQRRRERGK